MKNKLFATYDTKKKLLATYDMEELVKDRKRLDWMFSLNCQSWFPDREAIDKAMEEE